MQSQGCSRVNNQNNGASSDTETNPFVTPQDTDQCSRGKCCCRSRKQCQKAMCPAAQFCTQKQIHDISSHFGKNSVCFGLLNMDKAIESEQAINNPWTKNIKNDQWCIKSVNNIESCREETKMHLPPCSWLKVQWMLVSNMAHGNYCPSHVPECTVDNEKGMEGVRSSSGVHCAMWAMRVKRVMESQLNKHLLHPLSENQIAPPLQAIPCSFSVLLNLPEGITVTLLGMHGLACEQKTNVPLSFGTCEPKKVGNGIHHNTMCWNSLIL